MFQNIKEMRLGSIGFIQILCIVLGFAFDMELRAVLAQRVVERVGQPVGAFRIYPKTTFSCLGRPAGYYADIATGCQVYHMCDGLGRQFSYSCPNTTLFQQRMLICDHWYMVNCSKAESDYAANLLIGQRDKPFVPEEENQLRTPRPDLLDRPYAPDYSGESFRKQYKTEHISNEINDFDVAEKQQFNKINPPSPTRWHLPRSKPDIQTPSPNPIRRNDVIEENIAVDLGTSYSTHYNTSGDYSAENYNALVPTQRSTHSTPHTSKTEATTPTTTITTTTEIISSTPYIKPPSRLYEPPFLYPIYNINYTAAENYEDQNQQTSTTLVSTTTVTTTLTPTTSTTEIPFTTSTTKPSIFSGRPFAAFTTATSSPRIFTQSTQTTENYEKTSTNFIRPHAESLVSARRSQNRQNTVRPKVFETQTQRPIKISTTPQPLIDVSTPFLDLLPPVRSNLLPPAPFKARTTVPNEQPLLPSKTLLPPHQEFVLHDVATTQGPPIYFEWKIPSDGLEPPLFDAPTGIEDDSQPRDDVVSAGSTTITENYTTKSPFAHNPFLAPILNGNTQQQTTENSIKMPTVRSVPKTATVQSLISSTQADSSTTSKNNIDNNSAESPKTINIQQLQKDFLIPDFLFPLENDARISYEQSNRMNSFQLKIPEGRDNEKQWYGENPDCPECHPSFLKPGTCEPCVRR